MLKEAGSFFAIALVLLVGACVYIESQGGSPFAMHASGQSAQLSASGPSVVGGPSLSTQQVNTILTNAGSPAAGSGQTFYQDSLAYHVDDSVALAFFKHESSYGTRGEAAQSLSIGNLRCIDGYACQDNYAWFPSWQSGIDAWYRLISGPYYVGSGLTTIPQIVHKYAPNADNNDEVAYTNAVESDISSWRSA
jgi:hypothetical protein